MPSTRQLMTLQMAYRRMVYPYAPYLSTAATLTLKQYARVRVPRFDNVPGEYFDFCKKLNDEIIDGTIRRFNARLTHYLYGNQSRHPSKRDWAKPLVITVVEGRKTGKLPHLHIAVGNVPADKIARIGTFIRKAWHECDFGNQQVRVEPLTNAFGWLEYMTKEIGYADSDVIAIEHVSIPEIIQGRI